MKNTVYTVITVVLLMATLCLPATAQTWQRINSYSPSVGDWTGYIYDIAFRDNDLVCFSKGGRIFSWNINTGKVWWVDHDALVTYIAIPRRNGSVVIYSHGGFEEGKLEIRRTDNLDFIDQAHVYDKVDDLSVDELGDYVVGHTTSPIPRADDIFAPRYFTYDLWGSNGWQLSRNHNDIDGVHASGILPVRKDGFPYRYFCFWDDPDAIREKANKQPRWGDTYITGSASDTPVVDIAVGIFQGSVRIAGLLDNSRIDVWDWAGTRLFTFNENRAKKLNSEEYYRYRTILEFTPNGELLATVAYRGREVIFWDMSTREQDPSSFTANIPSSTYISALAISDNGKRLAVGSYAGRVYIYEWTGGSAPAAPAPDAEPAQPTALLENYPNPFNPETWIPYQLSETAEVTVTIHASDGKLVRTLELGQVPAGVYSEKDRAAYWDGQNEQGEPVASGVYFYTLTAGEFKATRKMVIRK